MTLLVPLAIWLALTGDKIKTRLPQMPLGKKNIFLIIGISLTLWPLGNVISALTMFFFPNDVAAFIQESILRHPLIFILLAVAVTPAICEEIVFRGYIQSTYKNKPLITMLLINALFFGLIHRNEQQFFYAFILGIILAYVVHATRSVRAAMIMHFIINALSITFMWIGSQVVALSQVETPGQPELLLTLALWGKISLFTTGIAMYLFREFVKHNKKRMKKYDAENPTEEKFEEEKKRSDFLLDTTSILVIVVLYVITISA
jgi:membrane protease YdiL (CAAX protease family)